MESVLPCARTRRKRFTLRIKRVLVLVTMFVSTSLIFTLYILTLTCCAGPVSMDPDRGQPVSEHQRVILVQDGDEDEKRYQEILDQVADNPSYSHLRRKPLLDDDDHDLDTNKNIVVLDTHASQPRHRTHGRRRHRDEDNVVNNHIVIRYNDEGDDQVETDYIEYDESSSLNSNKRTRKYNQEPSRLHQKASRKLPETIIIGVKKGGTRALLEFLRIHPDVRAPGPEPHFFDRNYDKGVEWYRRQMPPTYDGQLTIEKTPSYFVTKGVPGRIYNMSKNVKFIIVVRDPVTRAISDYTQALAKRSDIDSFEQMAFEDNSTGLVDTSWGAIRIGVYAKHLERWLQYFPLSQMHFVSGEKLIEDPAGEILKVQEFLGLDPLITDKNFSFNTTKGFPCLVRPNGNSRKPHCLGKTKGREHPKISPKVLQRLRDFFRPFNQKFYQMVGQDFGWS